MGCGASIMSEGGSRERRRRLKHRPQPRPMPAIEQPGVLDPAPRLASSSSGIGKLPSLRIFVPTALKAEEGLSETPLDTAADEYKYFCPVCMKFFRLMMETPCCSNYICAHCMEDYLRTKSDFLDDDTVKRLGEAPLESWSIPEGVPCPHCQTTSCGQKPMTVRQKFDVARSYFESPDTTMNLASASASIDFDALMSQASPTKVGEDFETMERKMSRADSVSKTLAAAAAVLRISADCDADIETESEGPSPSESASQSGSASQSEPTSSEFASSASATPEGEFAQPIELASSDEPLSSPDEPTASAPWIPSRIADGRVEDRCLRCEELVDE